MATDTLEAAQPATLRDALGELALVQGMVNAIQVLNELLEEHAGDLKKIFPLSEAIGACTERAYGLLERADEIIETACRAQEGAPK